ncbi:MAG: methylenetetrahydrofolate reductase [Spirochaetaceae bacterium]|nr:MAG: methylenetetrahydrofolate reductase [Spirochaetaceae bacterium]
MNPHDVPFLDSIRRARAILGAVCALQQALKKAFTVTVEVVPPPGSDPESLLEALSSLNPSLFYGFSVATNPVAKAHMSALALCTLVSRKVRKPAILHCTTRDHNRLSLQGLLWGARALGIETVLAASGDTIAYRFRYRNTAVRDLDVFGLVELARAAGLCTGVVFDPHPETDGLKRETERLKEKAARGAQFAVTQPVYTREAAEQIAEATRPAGVPVMLGILPLRTPRHARFLHEKVSGISVPEHIRLRMEEATDPVAEGISLSKTLLEESRSMFAGACLMPPFGHYEIVERILAS